MARATVIAYHAVGDCPSDDDPYNLFVSPRQFRRQMAYLARWRSVVALDALLAGDVPRKRPAVAITFDDGYRSVLTEAGPVLHAYGFPATVFVPTAFVGRRSEWLAPSPCPVEIMSPQELREADDVGIAVESHGHAHMDFLQAGRVEAEADLRASMEGLAGILARRPRYLAYPFGPSSPEARAAAEACGFDAAFSIDALEEGPYARERVQITPLDGLLAFALKTSGRYLARRHSALGSRATSLVRPLRRKR